MPRPPVPNSLFACPSLALRALSLFAPCRLGVGNLAWQPSKIANRARARRWPETAPQPRQPNIANRGGAPLAMLATFPFGASLPRCLVASLPSPLPTSTSRRTCTRTVRSPGSRR